MRKFVRVIVPVLCLGLAACGGGTGTSRTQILPPPNGQAALEVLFPPVSPGETDYSAVQTYLANNNPSVAGANFYVKWAVVDQGPGANPQYDFSSIDSELTPWMAAGKKVNLVVWPVSDGSANDSTPQYVLTNLGSSNTVTCTSMGSSEIIPNYFDASFQTPYKAFMAAVVEHYSANSSLGYIRFGLARGGETFPALGFDSDPVCDAVFLNSWGWTSTTWISYLTSMLNYEGTLNSPVQLMVGINEVNSDLTIPNAVAASAVQNGIGFGSQGLELSDVAGYPNCTVNWCNLFNQFTSQVPLELQTLTQTSTSGAPPAGSLVTLLPFAVQHHATIIELYYADWLTGFDPNYPGYDPAYASAIQAAAQAGAP
jgi:hypothetical protein